MDYENCVYLDMMYVLPEFRRKNVGAKLLAQMLHEVPDEHSILTFAWKPAIDFYHRHGS